MRPRLTRRDRKRRGLSVKVLSSTRRFRRLHACVGLRRSYDVIESRKLRTTIVRCRFCIIYLSHFIRFVDKMFRRASSWRAKAVKDRAVAQCRR